jgi:hypothetical protein
MPDIQIDTSQLTSPVFSIPEAETGSIGGSGSPPPTISLAARVSHPATRHGTGRFNK